MILSFKEIFVPAVVDGTKPHTIRAGQRWRVGLGIQFYKNARQKSMAKIRPDAVATVVQEIKVPRPLERYLGPPRPPVCIVDGHELTPLECEELALRDGFEDFAALRKFIDDAHGLPFVGQLIHWTDLRY
jgi:hypothetical protein